METLDQSPTDPEFVQDPYAFYRRARALGDFVWWADYDMPVATTHEAVSAVLTSRHMGREIPADKKPLVTERLKPFYDIEANSMLELERPRHSRLRGLVLRAFNSANIQTMAPEISQIADELIDDFPDGEFDLLTHFAQKLPARVIARLLGVPDTMVPNLLTWSNAMVGMYQARLTPEMEIAAADASQEFHDFLRSYVEERRLKPADDLITRLIVAEQNEARLTTDELISTCILLLNAGHEATVHTIGNGVNAFFDFGKDDDLSPTRINGTVEEIIRFDPPLHLFKRFVYDGSEIMGYDFKAGQEIGCLLGSACRDDAIWPDGDKFIPSRKVRKNMAFGAGSHFCLGASLARLELQIALPALISRCPTLQIAETPKFANLYHFHGLERLIVTR